MKLLFERCEPRAEILQGNIQESDLAADLAQVLNGTAPDIYKKADLFFKNTHPTQGLRDLLRTVCHRLNGQEGIAVLQLDTQYGGGKTHSLIALTHTASGMPGVENVAEFLDPSLVPQEEVLIAAFDGENADPVNGRPLGDGLRAYTPWGELAYRLGKVAGYELVRQSDRERVAPGADTLRELWGDRPALILLDELSIYLRKVKGRSEQEQLTPFLTSLFKAVSASPKVCVVFTLAIGKEGKAQDAYAQENEFIAAQLEEAAQVAGRVATVLNPTTEQETVQVLRRRLFRQIDDAGVEEVIAAYQQLWANNHPHLPPLSPQDLEQFRLGYPFHPALMSFLTDKLSTLSTFQRVRGMLRLLTRTVAELWSQKPAHTYAIHLHHLNPGYGPIRNEITTKLELSRYDPVIENDVSSATEQSLAQTLDAHFYGGLAPYASFVARNILWHTFAFHESLQGIDETHLRFSILAPDLELGFINDARNKFIQDAAYLDDRPAAPLRFLTEVNLLQLIRRQKELVDLNEARTQLQDRITHIFKGKTFNLQLFPQSAAEVPDLTGDGRPYLVVLAYDAIAISSTVAEIPDLVARIYQFQGSKEDFRHLRNNLVFLVADASKREEMKDQMRHRLALEAMRKPDKLRQLPEHQQGKINELYQRSEQLISTAIQQCYCHLFYPSNNKMEGSEVSLAHAAIELPAASHKPGNGQQQVIQKLIDNRRLILADGDPYNPTSARDDTHLKKGQISTAELRSEFRKNLKLPLLIGDEPFIKMVRQGIEQNLFVYQYAGLLYGKGDPYAEIKIDEQAFIYTLARAQEVGIWPRPPVDRRSSVDSNDPDFPGENDRPSTAKAGEILAPSPSAPAKPKVIRHEALLRQALTQTWEDTRSLGVQKIHQMTLRIFDVAEALKLLGAIGSIISKFSGEVHVKLSASYETVNNSTLELEFTGTIQDVSSIREFLNSQFRAAGENHLETIFTLTYEEGLTLGDDTPEKLTEQLARFVLGTVLIEIPVN